MNILDPRLTLWREALQRDFVTSGASFPLKASGVVLGALTVYTKNPDFWTKRTIIHLTNFAEKIAVAIHIAENRQRLKLLIAGLGSAANAIVITNRNGIIEWVNPAFLKLNRYSATEVEAVKIQLLKSDQHTRIFYKRLRQHIATGRIWHGEVTNCRKDGSQYISETTITPVRDETGKITNFIAIIQDITQRKQVDIQIEVGILPKIEIDYLVMEQIISNLVDNAIKYLDSSRQGKIETSYTENDKAYVVSVKDNGRGIQETDQEKICDLFRRCGNQDQPGEGMALAYVRTLMRKVGGKVWCESELGVGTKISFTMANSNISLISRKGRWSVLHQIYIE